MTNKIEEKLKVGGEYDINEDKEYTFIGKDTWTDMGGMIVYQFTKYDNENKGMDLITIPASGMKGIENKNNKCRIGRLVKSICQRIF